ncbi:response regulator [Terracoccus luteus]|uniref:Transcriptional regulatory protein n=1 Tax=Terracoccus luteus TaxID=53356 RepID=A0A839PSZ0_9MICO|nr:response regulator [Terracoccus luteus]MBB2986637.1 response regulator of citrate/malate metabolism [Terracoccus luteus]MCP2171774.1 response regulator of citrate/malate metabolism [Terracoccus luteus]
MIRVLVVDDDFMVARLHSSVVAKQPGFELVAVVNNGTAALAAAQSHRPDLILLDVYLPDITGLEVLGRLRAQGHPVDVIVISAARDVESLRTAMRGGVFQYLVKPFAIGDLRDRLEEYAAHRRRVGSIDEVGQAEADQLFRGSAARAAPLPKGISATTVALVTTALRAAGDEGLSATECGEQAGLSRSSARRYLEHLVEVGEAEVRHRYGSAGRPERRYRATQPTPQP